MHGYIIIFLLSLFLSILIYPTHSNIIVVNSQEVISEAHVFAEKTGLGSDVLENMIGEMFGPVLHSYSKRLTTGAYAPEPGELLGSVWPFA